jgi:hypothetical protein
MAVRLVPQGEQIDPAQALRTAYGHVADGYQLALRTPGVEDEEYARLVRCARNANKLAGRDLVRAVGGDA